MRQHFAELEQLQNSLLEMSALVAIAIQRSIAAVRQKDQDAASEVWKSEARINQIKIEIDDYAVTLLTLQEPMASDLRFVVAVLKINTDLERMGDLAVNISQRATSLGFTRL